MMSLTDIVGLSMFYPNYCDPCTCKGPLGCGRLVTLTSFRDHRSLLKYTIVGLCQDCQDVGDPPVKTCGES